MRRCPRVAGARWLVAALTERRSPSPRSRAPGKTAAAQLFRVREPGAVGGDQAAPDTVLADVPVPQRQLQALGAHRAPGADGDRRGGLVSGPGCVDADRE